MSLHLRRNAVAYVALFIALAGTSYAASQLPRGSVGPKQLKKNAVTVKKIADGAVQSSKLADAAVQGAKIADDAVGSAKIADDAVGNTKITDAAVGSTKIADGAVGSTKIADAAVQGAKIADGAVDSRALLDGSVAAGDLVPGAGLPDVLPSGRTLRGYWRARVSTAANGLYVGAPISFPIPLASAPTANFVAGAADPDCPGTNVNPQAAPGHLCVYEGFKFHMTFEGIADAGGSEGASRFGAGVDYVSSDGAGPSNASGTWAVTAP